MDIYVVIKGHDMSSLHLISKQKTFILYGPIECNVQHINNEVDGCLAMISWFL
jgi:hypothetical protein